jgi:esterase/lipase
MTIFMTGDCDELIDGQNSKTLYEMCSSVEKHYFEFEGSHNSDRPEEVMSEIMELIVKKVT